MTVVAAPSMPPSPAPSQPAGLLIVDKPMGMTSHDVVSKVRRAVGTRRVGHAGTLDPRATGVLICAVGGATRLLTYLQAEEKEYEALIVIGEGRLSDDADGEVTAQPGVAMLRDPQRARTTLIDAAAALTGPIAQVPPQVSAKHVKGRRAHALVRAGEQVDLAAVDVRVDQFRLRSLRWQPADEHTPETVWAEFTITVSAGTYIRSLARDLGAAVGSAGHVRDLRRTRAGAWTVADAVPLAQVVTAPPAIIDAAVALRRVMACHEVDAGTERALGHGRSVSGPWPAASGQPMALIGPSGGIAIVRREGEYLRPVTVLPGSGR